MNARRNPHHTSPRMPGTTYDLIAENMIPITISYIILKLWTILTTPIIHTHGMVYRLIRLYRIFKRPKVRVAYACSYSQSKLFDASKTVENK